MQIGLNKQLNYDANGNLLIATGFKSRPYNRELLCGMCRKIIYTERCKTETIYVVEQSVKYGHLCQDCWQKFNEMQ